MMTWKQKRYLVGVVFLVLISGCAGLNQEKRITAAPLPVAPAVTAVVQQAGDGHSPEKEEIETAGALTVLYSGSHDVTGEAVKVPEMQLPVKKESRSERARQQMNADQGSSSKPKAPAKGGVSFNFDNADLYEVIRTMAEILQINYIVEGNISGSVTIQTTGELDRAAVFPLFFQILELNGLAAVKEGPVYKITAAANVPRTPILARYGKDLMQIPAEDRMIMQIVPLEFILVSKIMPTLSPFLSTSGIIIPIENTNLMIVIDKAGNLKRILQLVDIFDVDLFDNIAHRFYRLEYTTSSDALGLINDLLAPYLKIKESEINIVNIERLNTLVAISSDERILDTLEMFIEKIDAQENSTDPRIFIYRVKNSDSSDLATLLNSVFGKPAAADTDSSRRDVRADEPVADKNAPPELFMKPPDLKKEPAAMPAGTAGISGSSSLSREVKIIADTKRNALIIEAVPADYLIVRQILTELDILPRQVLINVLILDVNLTDSRTLGVEWSFIRNRAGGESGLLRANVGADGLTFTTGITDEWLAALSALASDDRANVLSAPSVLASDNMPATINVVTQIPITTSTYDTDGGVTTTSVQYRDTGIILSVTPHINDHGMVSMEIHQEVSSVADTSASDNNPSFFNRNVKTFLTVKDRQSIVIGGLISETKSDTDKGVPFLSGLPGIGFLFGQEKKSLRKNELIIVITPRVINTVDDIDDVSRDFARGFEGFKNSKRLIDLLPDK